MKKRVVIAMSGGVDSSTAAYLLLKKGYEVIGITLKLFNSKIRNHSRSDNSACCGIQGINDARCVASKLGIRFYALNYKKEFKQKVIGYFTDEYRNGRTPNPCIACNERIKFGSLLKKAKFLGADYIATGHYVKSEYNKATKRYILKKPKDAAKDQSYFLFSLNQDALKHALFPLANLTKDEVRKIAQSQGLKVHNKPGSQEICFVPNDNYKSFLMQKDPKVAIPGEIVNKQGEILGQHKGIAFYTVGQRRGLGIPHKSPLYVIDIDKNKNKIIVGEKKEVYSKELIADNVNWISIKAPKTALKVKAMIRYRHIPAEATISTINKNRIGVKFTKPQMSITPGQAIVFYKRNTLVGGAIIKKVLK